MGRATSTAKVLKRVVGGAWSASCSFVADLASYWRGLCLMCLATVGGATVLTGYGVGLGLSFAGGGAVTWALSA